MSSAKIPRIVATPSEAIHALGGPNFVAKLFGFGPNTVRNWYKRGLPPETYSKLAPRLRESGHDFADELFQQYPAVFRAKLPASTTKSRAPDRSRGQAPERGRAKPKKK